jgi:hypothetical protein
MTLPVPNQKSPIAQVKGQDGKAIGFAFLIAPWNSWFQQFSQPAPKIVSVTSSPFTANANGTLILNGSAAIVLTRGSDSINLAGASVIIPIAIGDTVSWTGGTAKFLGA